MAKTMIDTTKNIHWQPTKWSNKCKKKEVQFFLKKKKWKVRKDKSKRERFKPIKKKGRN